MKLARHYYMHVLLMESYAMTKHIQQETLESVCQGRIDNKDGDNGRRLHARIINGVLCHD